MCILFLCLKHEVPIMEHFKHIFKWAINCKLKCFHRLMKIITKSVVVG